jgi:uncharacterized membrane protein
MDGRTIAWVSYITLIGWIIAFVSHSNTLVKSSLATFHLRQSFGLMLIWLALIVIRFALFLTIPILGLLITIASIGLFVLWVMGLINAVNGEEKPLPLLGYQFQQWFNFIR